MKLRFLDLIFSFFGVILLFPIIIIVFIICLSESGSPLFIQKRVGRNKEPFLLVKFRTMRIDTESVSSHLVSSSSVTRMGKLLRRTKVDELPQLWNVLRGDMSLVGPRPGLFNQSDLINARTELKIYSARPGITGLAQIKGIDMSTPKILAQIDECMLRDMNVSSYLNILYLTILGKGFGDRVNEK